MINDIHFPEQLSGDDLDEYLAKGWYRMGQIIFTTNHIVYEETVYRVYWLRYYIPSIQYGKSHQKIVTSNQHFSAETKPLQITEELEGLYALYKSSVSFQASETVRNFLLDGGTADIYNTSVIEIRDNNKLIGAGIFDNGNNSIAGIMNFYDPAYKKYSLGKYLMLLKINYAKSTGKTWYYPGYIVAGYPKFDYKLFIGKDIAEIYLPEFSSWMKYDLTLIIGNEN
jgi:leucyl-tRNA---protein transferase